MKRYLAAGVSTAVVGALLLAPVSTTAQAATSDTTRLIPTSATDAASVVDSAGPVDASNPANRYWGLPTVIVGDLTGMPMTQDASAFAGLVKDAGSAKYLPGWHAKGQHVLRGNAPEPGRISVVEKDGRYVVTVPVEARSALVGTRPKGAHEDIAVHLSVTDENGQTIVDRTSWQPLRASTGGVAQPQVLDFTLTAARTARIKALAPEVRDANLTVDVFQIIDTDGRKTKGRWTAEHIKSNATSLGASKAATQGQVEGQGVGLTVQNSEALTQPDGTVVNNSVNLTIGPNACMDTGTGGMAVFNYPGLASGSTLEGYLQQDTGTTLVDQLAGVASDLAPTAGAQITEEVLGQTFAEVTDTLKAFVAAVKWLNSHDNAGCTNTAGLFNLTANDAWGNSTQQAYGLNEFFANGSGYDSSGGGQDTAGAGGMADISTVYASTVPLGYYDGMSAGQDEFYTNYNTLLVSVYGSNGIGPAPLNNPITITTPSNSGTGGEAIAGGDAGLSFAVAPGSSGETASGWGADNAYPEIQLNVSATGDCSSVFGGTWGSDYATNPEDGQIEGTNNPAQFWDATDPAPGCTGGNSPNVIDPADWGTVSITAPVGAGGAQAPISTAAYVNETVSAGYSMPLNPSTSGFEWAWYNCGTDSTCSNPTMLSDAGSSTAWNAGYATSQTSFTVPASMNGNYLVLGGYPTSLGGINPGTIATSPPVQVQTLAPSVGPNPLGGLNGLTSSGANTLELTGPNGSAAPVSAGTTLTAATPNNWQDVADSGGAATYKTTWYGCDSVSTSSGAGVCTSWDSSNVLVTDAAAYTIPGETDYDAVFFTQTVTVTYSGGASYNATGTSNTLFMGGSAPTFTTLPTLSVAMSTSNTYASPSLTGPPQITSPQNSGNVTVTYQTLTCDWAIPAAPASPTLPTCSNPNGPGAGWGNQGSAVTENLVNGTTNGNGVGGFFQPEFTYGSTPVPNTSDVAMVLQVSAANDVGSTTVYSNVWSAQDTVGPVSSLATPTVQGSYFNTGSCTTGGDSTEGYALWVNQGSYNLPINQNLTAITWSVTPTGAGTPTVTTGQNVVVNEGTPVSATVQTYGMDGSPVPGGPWTASACWPAQ